MCKKIEKKVTCACVCKKKVVSLQSLFVHAYEKNRNHAIVDPVWGMANTGIAAGSDVAGHRGKLRAHSRFGKDRSSGDSLVFCDLVQTVHAGVGGDQ